MLLYTDDTELDAGIYLREERTKFRELRNLLNIAQSSLRKLLETPTSSQDLDLQRENFEDWNNLQQACAQTLKQESRDIEVFVWWLAALAFNNSNLSAFNEGLDDFLYALNALNESIHPKLPEKKVAKLDEDQVAAKHCENQTRALEQLTGDSPSSGLLNVPLMRFPLIDDYTYSDYLSDQKSGSLEQVKGTFITKLQANKKLLTEQFSRIIELDKKIGDIDLFINGYRNKFGHSLLGFRFIRDNLKQIKLMYLYFFPDVDKQDEQPSEAVQPQTVNTENSAVESTTPATTQVVQATPSVASTPVAATQAYTRENALEDLNRIAVFFKKTEPHSPIPYLIARAIRWGNMSFSELLGELIKKESPELAEIRKLTGVDNDLGELLNDDIAITAPIAEVEEIEQASEIAVSQPVVQAEPNQTKEPETDTTSSSGPLW